MVSLYRPTVLFYTYDIPTSFSSPARQQKKNSTLNIGLSVSVSCVIHIRTQTKPNIGHKPNKNPKILQCQQLSSYNLYYTGQFSQPFECFIMNRRRLSWVEYTQTVAQMMCTPCHSIWINSRWEWSESLPFSLTLPLRPQPLFVVLFAVCICVCLCVSLYELSDCEELMYMRQFPKPK